MLKLTNESRWLMIQFGPLSNLINLPNVFRDLLVKKEFREKFVGGGIRV